MAEPADKLILNIIQEDCTAPCPYRQGDGVNSRRLSEKIAKKLKHRVADGNEVRVLERRVKELETVVERIIEAAEKGRKLNPQEIAHLKRVRPVKR